MSIPHCHDHVISFCAEGSVLGVALLDGALGRSLFSCRVGCSLKDSLDLQESFYHRTGLAPWFPSGLLVSDATASPGIYSCCLSRGSQN